METCETTADKMHIHILYEDVFVTIETAPRFRSIRKPISLKLELIQNSRVDISHCYNINHK